MLTVAEIGINHNGDMNIIKSLINICTCAGIDYVKFQKRDINLVYTKEQLNSKRLSPWGTTYREQKEALELSKEQYAVIDRYCLDKKIGWFASVWDVNSVDFVKNFDCPFIKVPSAMITNTELLEKVSDTKIPVILSTGMSTMSEVRNALNILGDQTKYVLVCNSSYPCPPGKNKIFQIPKYKKIFSNRKVGFSSHSKDIEFVISAVTLGIDMLEFHVTLDRNLYGTDQSSSLEASEILRIMKFSRYIEKEKEYDYLWNIFPEELIIKKKLRRN